jgi:hypothetical protein
MFMSPEMMAQLPTLQAGMAPYMSSMSGQVPPSAFQQEQAADAQGANMALGQPSTAGAPPLPMSAQPPANAPLPAYSTAQPMQAPTGEADWQHPHSEVIEREGPGYLRHLIEVGQRHGGEAAAFHHARHVFHMMQAGHHRAADHLDQRVAEAIAHHGSLQEAVHWGHHVAQAMHHIVAAHRAVRR